MITIIILDFYIDLRKSFANISPSTVIIIDLYLKYIISNEVIIYKKFDIVKSLT